MAMAYLAKASDIDLIHVPYKGSAPAVADMMSGVINSTAAPLSLLGPFVQSDRIRAIGIAGEKRAKALPNVPTLKEQGYANLDASWALAVVAPAATPLQLRNKIAADIRTVLNDSKFVEEQFDRFGYTPVGDTPEQFGQYLLANASKQAARVKAANVKLD